MQIRRNLLGLSMYELLTIRQTLPYQADTNAVSGPKPRTSAPPLT